MTGKLTFFDDQKTFVMIQDRLKKTKTSPMSKINKYCQISRKNIKSHFSHYYKIEAYIEIVTSVLLYTFLRKKFKETNWKSKNWICWLSFVFLPNSQELHQQLLCFTTGKHLDMLKDARMLKENEIWSIFKGAYTFLKTKMIKELN